MDSEKVAIDGFTVIQTRVENRETGHVFYVKEFDTAVSGEHKPKRKTLHVLNIPPYVTKTCIEKMFSSFGKVKSVAFAKNSSRDISASEKSKFFQIDVEKNGFKEAYVTFANPATVQNVTETPFTKILVLPLKEGNVVTGTKKWSIEYKEKHTMNTKKIQSEIDKYMESFDKKEKEEVEKAKMEAETPDEDGWIKVTRHGKNKGVPRTEVMQKKSLLREKRKKDKELLHFYAFQIKEGKMQHLEELKKKFEEDKSKIAKMRAQRKFKPY